RRAWDWRPAGLLRALVDLGLDRGRLALGLFRLRLRRRRPVTPIDEPGVQLLERDAGRLPLAGLQLRPGAPHQLLGPAGGDEDHAELAVHRRRIIVHRIALLGSRRPAPPPHLAQGYVLGSLAWKLP